VGDQVRLFDGRGSEATAHVVSLGRSTVELFVEAVRPADPRGKPLPVTLAVAMPKGARQDVLVEKCTELGVQAIWPIVTRLSVVRPGEGRVDHWRQVSIAAAKQARRSYLPDIATPRPFEEMRTRVKEFGVALFGSMDPAAPGLPEALGGHTADESTLVVIGPEGGLDTDEEASLVEAGAKAVSLGRCVLRIETAAIVSLAIIGARFDASKAN
jgi:16S rRNA (uracil1498-N3)-methyltransferase